MDHRLKVSFSLRIFVFLKHTLAELIVSRYNPCGPNAIVDFRLAATKVS